MVTLLFMMFFIAALETTAHGNDDAVPQTETPVPEDPDICVGCDDKEEAPPELTVEIVIDPLTGNVQYVIKGLEIE